VISSSDSVSFLHVLRPRINLPGYYLVKRDQSSSQCGSLCFFPLGAAFFFPGWPATKYCSGLYDFKANPSEVAVLKLKLKRETFLSSLSNNNNKTPCECSAFHVVPSAPPDSVTCCGLPALIPLMSVSRIPPWNLCRGE
jgi:hypothetical protein